MLSHLSLFSGIGGLDLAAEQAGFQTVGQCEWADYPTKILKKHWPDVPRWRDIRALTKESFYERTGLRTVDVVSGGFPCQPFSTAGKMRGEADDRYLWPEMFRIIRELRPTWVVGENVAGFIGMALDEALSDLESENYKTRAFLFPACGIGAPHRRNRCAIVAFNSSCDMECENGKIQERANSEPSRIHGSAWGESGKDESGMDRVVDGVPNRMDRLKCLGNAVVPQQFYPIFEAIYGVYLSQSQYAKARMMEASF